jgi:hypothetical protein
MWQGARNTSGFILVQPTTCIEPSTGSLMRLNGFHVTLRYLLAERAVICGGVDRMVVIGGAHHSLFLR